MNLNLEDLAPQEAIFTGKTDEGEEIELKLRPFNLRDEAWLKRKYGGDKLQKVFDSLDSEEICRIAFNQLDNASKKKLFYIKFESIDEETGEVIEEKLSGHERLSFLIRGLNELMELMKRLLETRGISMPVIEKMSEEELGKLTEALRNSGFSLDKTASEEKNDKTGEKSST